MTRIATLALALLLVPALSGCMSTFKGVLTNRVVVNVAQDGCATNSRWFGIAIGADVDERDCQAILQALKLRAAMEALAADAASQRSQGN